jgi:hypothetical protein
MTSPHTRRTTRLLAVATMLLFQLPAWAASPSSASAQSRYQQDRAACLDSSSQHDRSSCLREAGAVRAESIRGRAVRETADDRARNALQRCNKLPSEMRDPCERRVRGEGTVSGSVAAGGVLRELVIPVPAAAPVQAPPPPR